MNSNHKETTCGARPSIILAACLLSAATHGGEVNMLPAQEMEHRLRVAQMEIDQVRQQYFPPEHRKGRWADRVGRCGYGVVEKRWAFTEKAKAEVEERLKSTARSLLAGFQDESFPAGNRAAVNHVLSLLSANTYVSRNERLQSMAKLERQLLRTFESMEQLAEDDAGELIGVIVRPPLDLKGLVGCP